MNQPPTTTIPKKHFMRISFFILCLFLTIVSAHAQQFGGTPPSVKWRQINTDTVRIIYPHGLDSQANRVATLMHLQAAENKRPLGGRLKKIQVVLQNQTVIPNGYVGLGPYRSELYLTPPTETFQQGTIPWTDQLALHEYRHVQQFNNFHNGLSKVMASLFGQEGYALAVNASVPDWFYEGDAVYTETVLTKQGRGRLPLFQNAYPSLWSAGKRYSWMKLRNGSLKDYVPNHYDLGYLLVNYGYGKYGTDFWQKVTKDASAFKGLFYPFQKAIQRHAGVSYKTFREEALKSYEQQATAQQKKQELSAVTAITNINQRVVQNHLFPFAVGTDSVLFLKTSYNRRPVFVLKDNAGEHRLRVRDISIDDQFSYRNGKVVYAAYENDARWRWRNYSVIKLWDIQSGKQVSLTKKTKYFTPDIDASGKQVVAVEQAVQGTSSLHLLDASTGAVKKRIPAWGGHVFMDPKFVNEDTVVTVVRLPDGKSVLALADWQTGTVTRLTPPSFQVAGNPSVSNGHIYFTAAYDGLDHVYMLKPGDKQLYQLTNGQLGEYFVNAGQGKITWSAFTADGYQLQQADESALVQQSKRVVVSEDAAPLFAVQQGVDATTLLPASMRSFESKPYRKSTNLFNFHSWRPYYEDPLFYFSLYGENTLNTLQTEIYYQYNENDRTNAVGVSAIFAQWFPYLQAGVEYTFDRQVRVQNRLKQWSQLDPRIGLSIPLSWTKGRTNNYFTAGTNYYYRSDFNKGFYKDTFATVSFGYLQHYIQLGQQVQMARQHIFPRLGYNLSMQYRYITNNYKSWQVHTSGSLYLPGALPTHSLVLTGAYLETDTVNSAFGNIFAYPRGYNALSFPTVASMWRTSANYHFPLLYPDWGFANILYIQRIRANAFFDYGKVFSKDKRASAEQRTIGGEIYADTRWWNQYELTFGFRVSHLLDTDFYTGRKGATVFEFIMPVSIIPR